LSKNVKSLVVFCVMIDQRTLKGLCHIHLEKYGIALSWFNKSAQNILF